MGSSTSTVYEFVHINESNKECDTLKIPCPGCKIDKESIHTSDYPQYETRGTVIDDKGVSHHIIMTNINDYYYTDEIFESYIKTGDVLPSLFMRKRDPNCGPRGPMGDPYMKRVQIGSFKKE